MKTCKKCLQNKPILLFYKHKGMLDGHLNICKECKISYQKTLIKNPEYGKKYYLLNKNKWKNNWWKNRDKNLERGRVWKRNNKEKVNTTNGIRRDLKKHKDCNLSKNYELLILNQFFNKCFNCNSRKNKLTLDHHIPLSKNGKLEFGNIVILCSSCNSRKYNKDPHTFYSREKLSDLNTLLMEQRNF